MRRLETKIFFFFFNSPFVCCGCCNFDGSVMVILTQNSKFNIRHHLVVADDIVGGGRIFCEGSFKYVVTCLELHIYMNRSVKLKLYNRSLIAQTACVLTVLNLVSFMELCAIFASVA